MKRSKIIFLFYLLYLNPLMAQKDTNTKVESNVIYGMHGGLALLMDVIQPQNPNGYGIIIIPGSGWHQRLSYDAPPLNKNPWYLSNILGTDRLLENRYTLFIINHRAAPVFRFPAAVEDAQRAVQFIRHSADRFGIDPEKIGAIGHSSGGHLVNMLGTMEDIMDTDSENPIANISSRVQAVVSLSSANDLYQFVTGKDGDGGAANSFLGIHFLTFWGNNLVEDELSIFSKASPMTYVTSDDAPFLLVHGDKDDVVPIDQSQIFTEKLQENNVPVTFIDVENGNHLFVTEESGKIDNGAYYDEMVKFFDKYLQMKD